MARSEIRLIGYLQKLDRPFASLYYNMGESTMFVCVYIMDKTIESVVTASDVQEYLDGHCSLRHLMHDKDLVSDSLFIEELCNERNRIEYFLTHTDDVIKLNIGRNKYRIGHGKNITHTRATVEA